MNSSKVLENIKKMFAITVLVLMISTFTMSAQAHAPNYADCMKNPFASGCRGISAKRSQLPAIQQSSNMDNIADTHFPAFRWPQTRTRFNLADLLFQPIEMQPPPFVGTRRIDLLSPSNLEFYQLSSGDPRSISELNNGRQQVIE